jgi:ABC-type dipeptide/oligopeptide/nickel transport system permease subunit
LAAGEQTMEGQGEANATRLAVRSQSLASETLRRFAQNKGALLGSIALVLLIFISLAAPLIAPHDPIKQFVGPKLAPPSLEFPFGTDQFGRDVLSRTIWGGRNTLRVPLIAVGIAVVAGVVLGLISGYYGGRADAIISWFMDVMLAFPGLLLTLVVVAMLGTGLEKVMIAVGISFIPVHVRLVRGSVLSAKQNDYVLAAQVVGCKDERIAFRHVFPNVVPSLLVLATTAIAWAIVAGAAMNFLGLGVQPPVPEWGADMAMSRNYLRESWWMMTFPGLGIVVTIISVNLIGDGLTMALDPRLRGR